MKKLYGVTIAMVTPFTKDNKVDLGAMGALTEFLIDKGVQCLYPCGTTGEMFHLSAEERMAVAEQVVRTAEGRVTVFIHAGASTPQEALALSRHAREIGADGVGVVTPTFFGMNERELVNYYVDIAKQLPEDFPIYLYNIPQCAANDLSVAAVTKVAAQCPNVVGLKYSFPDMIRTQEYLGAREGFSVLQGGDRLFLASLAMGCDGTVSGSGSVYPEPLVEVYKAYLQGDFVLARKWQRIANALIEAMRCGSNMAYYKDGLKRRGQPGGFMRYPQLDLTEAESEAYHAVLADAEKLLLKGYRL